MFSLSAAATESVLSRMPQNFGPHEIGRLITEAYETGESELFGATVTYDGNLNGMHVFTVS